LAPRVVLDHLVSLEKHPDAGIQHFSGTARYSHSVELDPTTLSPGKRLWVDLGKVNGIAEVFINGRSLGILWGPPYVVDITSAARPGSNDFSIAVTGTWRNRLIGQAKYHGTPPSPLSIGGGVTPALSTDLKFSGSEPLSPFGLVGPVRVGNSVIREVSADHR